MSPTSRTGASREARDAHVDDVVLAQIDLGRAPGPLDEDEVVAHAAGASRLSATTGQMPRMRAYSWKSARPHTAPRTITCERPSRLRLEQDGIHVHARRDAGGLGLRGLGAPDLAPIG